MRLDFRLIIRDIIYNDNIREALETEGVNPVSIAYNQIQGTVMKNDNPCLLRKKGFMKKTKNP